MVPIRRINRFNYLIVASKKYEISAHHSSELLRRSDNLQRAIRVIESGECEVIWWEVATEI
jgi:hypothetical protein